MIVEFDKSFEKSLDKINDKSFFSKLEKVILAVEAANSLMEVTHIKKLAGFGTYYRVRIGSYRLGIEKLNDRTIRLIVVAHRKDIYKLFP